MNRRNLLGGLASILATGFAPAAVGSGILMPIRKIAAANRTFFLDGQSDDESVFKQFIDGEDVYFNGKRVDVLNSWELEKMTFRPGRLGYVNHEFGQVYLKEPGGLRLQYVTGRNPGYAYSNTNRFALVQPRDGGKDNRPYAFPLAPDNHPMDMSQKCNAVLSSPA